MERLSLGGKDEMPAPVWYRIEVSLERNPKFLTARTRMGWDSKTTLWALHRLWSHAREHAPDGRLEAYSAGMLAAICDVPEAQADAWLSTLLTAELLDATQTGDYHVHDWMGHNGQFLAESARKSLWRLNKASNSESNSLESTRKGKEESKTIGQTQGDITCGSDGTATGLRRDTLLFPDVETLDAQGVRSWDSAFEGFWNAWPTGYKIARGKCFAIWKRIRPQTAESLQAIAEGLNRWKNSRRWSEGFICDPVTFLNQKRWLDEPQQAEEAEGVSWLEREAAGGSEKPR